MSGNPWEPGGPGIYPSCPQAHICPTSCSVPTHHKAFGNSELGDDVLRTSLRARRTVRRYETNQKAGSSGPHGSVEQELTRV